MSGKTNIAWTENSWQTVYGCTEISPGCVRCYARTLAHRLAAMGQLNYQAVTKPMGGWNSEIVYDESQLEIPLRWKKPRRIFVNSMSDTFHKDVPFEFIDKIFAVMALCPQHVFQVLTKRADRMAEYLNDKYDNREEAIGNEVCVITKGQNPGLFVELPLPNVWLGVTAENQEQADKRIPILLGIPAAKRFVSVEPMLGPVDLDCTKEGVHALGCGGPCDCAAKLSQVIIGCESGPHRRPCKIEWVESLVAQCKAAGVAVFVKQLSINGKVEKDVTKFPKHLQLQEYPK
jgi:protein gp37